MNGLRLPPHIHYGVAGGERIFLDLHDDRYFRLPADDEQIVEALEQGEFAAASAGRRLVESGLLTYSSKGRPVRPTCHRPPHESLVEREDIPAPFGLRDLIEIWCDLLWARKVVSGNRLPSLGQSGAIEESGEAARRLRKPVAKFHAARPFVPISTNCLRDSLALRRYLARRGIGVRLVIGAKLHPFSAHCWLQHGDQLLNDNLSAARGFAPVLVL